MLAACNGRGPQEPSIASAATDKAKPSKTVHAAAPESIAVQRVNAERALRYVREIVGFGPRPMGSEGHRKVEAYLRARLKNGGNKKAAEVVGQRIAEKAKAAGIESVAFDRAGYRYHGRVRALAEAARVGGLKF